MLVLSRRRGEKILFPESDIVLTVLQVSGSSVRIGVAAPRDVPVLRAELVERAGRKPSSESAPPQAIYVDNNVPH